MTSEGFTVLFWGSHPDEDNDDCWEGLDFARLDEAREMFAKATVEAGYATAYIELDGPGVYEIARNQNHDPARVAREEAAARRAWQREIATEAGMLGGCDGYNEVMGY